MVISLLECKRGKMPPALSATGIIIRLRSGRLRELPQNTLSPPPLQLLTSLSDILQLLISPVTLPGIKLYIQYKVKAASPASAIDCQ